MIVYVYDKTANGKKLTFKNVQSVNSLHNKFEIVSYPKADACRTVETVIVPKDNVKLVVYGF